MKIENAKYDINKHTNIKTIICTINGVYSCVPMNENNSDYAEILKQVADGTITIKDAE